MAQPYPRVYLASRSARRRDLLKQIDVGFEVLLFRDQAGRVPDVDETPQPGELPEDYVLRVCREKAELGWKRLQQRNLPRLPVLAADTTVCLDNAILGKPADRDQAAAMLRSLAGREHRVLTAVGVLDTRTGRSATRVVTSRVRMKPYDARAIDDYVASGEPLDKAGAYAVQGLGGALVDAVVGSYSNVVGLPLEATRELLAAFGVPVTPAASTEGPA